MEHLEMTAPQEEVFPNQRGHRTGKAQVRLPSMTSGQEDKSATHAKHVHAAGAAARGG